MILSCNDKHIKLCTYEEAMSAPHMLNLSELGTYIWLAIPKGLSKHITLTGISEVCMSSEDATIDYTNLIDRDKGRIWIQVNTSILNQSIGLHMYQLSFTDTTADVDICLYFCYQIQSNTPDKPYIYMPDKS